MRDLDIRDFDGEPRMRDLDIAMALEFEHPRRVRQLIERNMDELLSFGVCTTVVQTHGPQGGRPGTEYWLNEEQALFICTRSEAKGAIALTKQMVMIFAAWRRGQMPPAPVAAPCEMQLHPDAYLWRGIVREARILFGRDRARWLWHQSPLPQLPDFVDEVGNEASEPQAILLLFLRARFEVTGSRSDFITSRKVLTIFAQWAGPLGYVLSERAVSIALKAIALGYRDPVTGRGFSSHKRNVSGYIGLRLRPLE